MEEVLYPAIFYYDEEYNDYAVEFYDVCIYTEGETMQEAYKNAQKFLKAYLKCCKDISQKPVAPSNFEDVPVNHKNGKVMLVSAPYECVPSAKKKETFSNLNDGIIEEVGEVDLFDQQATIDDRIKSIENKKDD